MPIATIFALAAGLLLVAVPLSLWRIGPRPPGSNHADPGGSAVPRLEPGLLQRAAPPQWAAQVSARASPVRLSPFRTLRCVKAGPGRTPPERCEHLREFEQALARAIHERADLGPSTLQGAVISFVLDVDFRRRRWRVYRGKSSTLPKSETASLFRAVRQAMPTVRWRDIEHDHERYVVYVKATYPPSKAF